MTQSFVYRTSPPAAGSRLNRTSPTRDLGPIRGSNGRWLGSHDGRCCRRRPRLPLGLMDPPRRVESRSRHAPQPVGPPPSHRACSSTDTLDHAIVDPRSAASLQPRPQCTLDHARKLDVRGGDSSRDLVDTAYRPALLGDAASGAVAGAQPRRPGSCGLFRQARMRPDPIPNHAVVVAGQRRVIDFAWPRRDGRARVRRVRSPHDPTGLRRRPRAAEPARRRRLAGLSTRRRPCVRRQPLRSIAPVVRALTADR